jgi:hypothetical protein
MMIDSAVRWTPRPLWWCGVLGVCRPRGLAPCPARPWAPEVVFSPPRVVILPPQVPSPTPRCHARIGAVGLIGLTLAWRWRDSGGSFGDRCDVRALKLRIFPSFRTPPWHSSHMSTPPHPTPHAPLRARMRTQPLRRGRARPPSPPDARPWEGPPARPPAPGVQRVCPACCRVCLPACACACLKCVCPPARPHE